MSRFTVTHLPIEGLKRVERMALGDRRGFLARIFCATELSAVGWIKPVAQVNHTLTARKGTVRGLHFQKPPYAEMKLVSCLRGKVWDVAVDLRADSPTFRRWHAEVLSADNHQALLIPEGFAHGFQALGENTEMLYCHSTPYTPEAEAGINALDPELAIAWPLPVAARSPRDETLPGIGEIFSGLRV